MFKAHAYGNDFLLMEEDAAAPPDAAGFARRICDRHRGVGADGLILYRPTAAGAAMRLLNADGSYSEISGNGLRCLAALLSWRAPDRREIVVETDAGPKRLEWLSRDGTRFTFRAAMGAPSGPERVSLDAGGARVSVAALRVGNPQCVLIVPERDLTEEALHRFGPALTAHPHFPQGTNVELASVVAPDRIRILIWERGVGPTEASGTGACAAAVAAAAFGGAARDVQVIAPGGAQRVEWREDGLYLTGWAELLCEVQWLTR